MEAHPAAVHHTILVVDMEKFGDPARTNLHQLAVRGGMYDALRGALTDTGIPWDRCTTEDRGDGAMILLPAEAPKSHLVDQFPYHLAAAISTYNSTRVAEARIRLRVALHAGEVHYDGHGVTGHALNLAFRLLEAPVLKAALARAPGVLALITSDWFYREVVWHHPPAEPSSYHEVTVAVKETTVAAWVRLPGEPAGSGLVPGSERVGQHSSLLRLIKSPQASSHTDAFFALIDALLEVPCVLEDDTRRILVAQLKPDIAKAIAYHAKPRYHVINIVRTCLNYDGGLAELLALVESLEGDSLPVLALRRTVAVVRPQLTDELTG